MGDVAFKLSSTILEVGYQGLELFDLHSGQEIGIGRILLLHCVRGHDGQVQASRIRKARDRSLQRYCERSDSRGAPCAGYDEGSRLAALPEGMAL